MGWGGGSWANAVALGPGISSSGGDNERKRLLAGAANRRDTALLASSICDVNDGTAKRVMSRPDASVMLPLLGGSVGVRALP